MTGVIATIPRFQFSSTTGVPLALGTLTVYLAGTTTPTDTWQDSALSSLNTNPVVLDSSGSCILWLDSTKSYKFILKNAAGATQWTEDNVSGALSPVALAASSGASLVGYLPAGTGAVASTVQAALRAFVTTDNFGGGSGDAAADLAAINAGIAYLKTLGKGVLTVLPNIVYTVQVPALNLSVSQSITVIDQRTNKANSGNDAFGTYELYIEGKDASGNYATELRVRGKQNPAFTLNSVSDGMANGYSITNKASSFMHLANGANWYQYITDPLFKGYKDWGLYQYTNGGSGSFAIHSCSDANNKTRHDFTPSNLVTTTINISSVTNTSPIVVNLASPHGIAATQSFVSIAGVGTGVNGSWLATATGASQLTLTNSVAAGAFGAVGTASVQVNSQRATLNIPKIQDGTEAALLEGKLVMAVTNGTAPIESTTQTAGTDLHARPYVVDATTGTQQNNGAIGTGGAKIVTGTVTLVAGAATVVLGGDAPFTSATSYVVTCTDMTAANAVKVVRTAYWKFDITGTGTDVISFIAIGY